MTLIPARHFSRLPVFGAGFIFGIAVVWVPNHQSPAHAAPPVVAPALRTDVFARVARDREASVVFLHTIGDADTVSGLPAWIQPVREGLGTGIVIEAGGLVLTNAHVVAGARAVHVRTVEGEDIDAAVIGVDADTDVALLRAQDARALRPAPLGDSDKVRAGDLVVAIGNPLGLHHTVTTGVISAKARGFDDTGIEFLQTDAALNPGNSGGPLLNVNGEVIGLTTAILSKFGENIGLNLAIPINVVEALLPRLRNGTVAHGWLGVTTHPLLPSDARALGIVLPGAVIVTGLHKESPAITAGIHVGDVLVGLGARPAVAPAKDLNRRLLDAVPGDTLVLQLWRGGQQLTIPVVAAAKPQQ